MEKETLDIWARRDGKNIILSIKAKGIRTKEISVPLDAIPDKVKEPVRILKFK